MVTHLRSDLHIARKLWHSIALLLVIVFFHNLDRSEALRAMGTATFIFVALDLLRHRIPSLNKALTKVFSPVMRQHEMNSLAGTTYLLIGILIVTYIFPKPIAKLTFFFVAVGDPIASYFGIRFGRDRLIGKKTLQGTMAAFFACTIISFLFFYSGGHMQGRLILASLFAGIIGALGELIPFGKLDDNLTYPIFSATFLYGLFNLYGYWG